jgi:hypothetical protein
MYSRGEDAGVLIEGVDTDELALRAAPGVEAIERYRAEHGTAPNGLVIDTTGHMLAAYQSG